MNKKFNICLKNKRKTSNKKKKILLATLISCSIIILALAFGLGFGLGCKSSKNIFTKSNDIQKYLKQHKTIHKDTYVWTSETDFIMLAWLWDRNNFGKQNMINGMLYLILAENLTGFENWEIILNSNKNWFEIDSSYQYANLQKQTLKVRIDINKNDLNVLMCVNSNTHEAIFTSYSQCKKSQQYNYANILTAPSQFSFQLNLDTDEYPNITWPT